MDHLSPESVRRLEVEEDTVDLLLEVDEIDAGQEVFNQYGNNLSSSQLLVEWGYFDPHDTPREYLQFDLDELGGSEQAYELWSPLGELRQIEGIISDTLIQPPNDDEETIMGIDRSTGKITLGMWLQIYFTVVPSATDGDLARAFGLLQYLEQGSSMQMTGRSHQDLAAGELRTARAILGILQRRLDGLSPRLVALVFARLLWSILTFPDTGRSPSCRHAELDGI